MGRQHCEETTIICYVSFAAFSTAVHHTRAPANNARGKPDWEQLSVLLEIQPVVLEPRLLAFIAAQCNVRMTELSIKKKIDLPISEW
jgi:hypothetical protein